MSEQQGEVAPQVTQASPAPAVRPSVLSLAIRERSALYSAYMPFLKNGGIFVPTSRPFKIGDEVFLLLDLMDEPAKFQIAGTIVWVTPAGASHGRVQGIGIHFPEDETGTRVRLTIEKHLGSALSSSRPTHTL